MITGDCQCTIAQFLANDPACIVEPPSTEPPTTSIEDPSITEPPTTTAVCGNGRVDIDNGEACDASSNPICENGYPCE